MMEGRSGGWIEVNGEDILGKKLVDKSIFRHGTTLPKDEVYKYFDAINRDHLERGESEVVTFLIDEKEFKALFRNVKSDKRDDTYQFLFRKELKNYIKETLKKSYKYIFKYNENPDIEKPQEYIEFYKVDKMNTFKVELIADEGYEFNEEENIENGALEESNKLLKEEFFKYIGAKEENISVKYQKSYKMVLLIALLELSDFEGKAVYEDICSYIKDIYFERHKQGLAAETPDSEIQKSIEELSIKTVRDVMNENPYAVISKKGYILKEYIDEVEYLSFDKELWNELTDDDKEELIDILKYKLNKYYLEKGLGAMNSKKYYLYNISYQYPNVWQHCLSDECAAVSYIPELDGTSSISRALNVLKQIDIGDKIIAYAKPQQIIAMGEVIKTYYIEDDESKFAYNGAEMDKTEEGRTYKQRIGVKWISVLSHPLYIEQFNLNIEEKNSRAKAGNAFSELTENGFNNAEKLINNILWSSTSKFLDNVEEAAAAKAEEDDVVEEAILKKLSSLEEANFESKDVVEYIYNYITEEGYEYSKDIIKNLYLSLKTKPFVILYGISGTGKSKLVELFAKALGASREDETYNLIPVRPDWSDASELIGYRNIEGKFQPGILTNIIKKAAAHKEIPYFVCLDEMNLAKVEYYFSDILSIMETRNNKNGEIKTDKLIRRELFAGDTEAVKSFENLYIPENLYIIGTVNMDETTFPFSKKVLDRANTIEFNQVNLDYAFDREKVEVPPKVYPNKLILSEYIKISECSEKKDIAKKVIGELIEINNILEQCDMQFAYRVRDEIVFYVIYAASEGIMDFHEALDYSINQKILPRISGSSSEVEQCLFTLFKGFSNMDISSFDTDYIDEEALKKMKDHIKDDKKNLKDGSREKSVCKYPISSEKILKMLWRFNKDGFTTFW